MKIIKKIISKIKYEICYRLKIQGENPTPSNESGKIKINPQERNIDVPKIIWVYWEGKSSKTVDLCIDRIIKLHPDHDVRLLNPMNLHNYIREPKTKTILNHEVSPQLKSDIIRLELLYQYGGIWIDASVLIYKKLNWALDLMKKNRTKSFAYYRKNNTTNKDRPVIESWLLITEKENEFFRLWLNELIIAIQKKPKNYIDEIKKSRENHTDIFQNIGRLEYLVTYVACQVVMQKEIPSISLIDCDENAFLFQVINSWSKEKFLINMAINRSPHPKPYLIKLTGSERKVIDKVLSNQKFLNGTLLAH